MKYSIRICLVGCGRAKLDRPAPASELYTGPLFTDALGYAQDQLELGRFDAIRILSAKHGLLRLDQVIEPYDVWLGQVSKRVTSVDAATTGCSPWKDLVCKVDTGLWVDFGLHLMERRAEVTVLGGAPYVALVGETTFDATFRDPLKGLTQGARRSWFKRQREALNG